MRDESRSEAARTAVWDALRLSPTGVLTESAISKATGIKGMWLSHALIGLLHSCLVELIVDRDERGKKFLWRQAGRTRPGFSGQQADGEAESPASDSTSGRCDESPRPVPNPPSVRERTTGRDGDFND